MKSIRATCSVCHRTAMLTQSEMERHVAILHGDGAFSTIRCCVCNGKYYDFIHFQGHLKESAKCLNIHNQFQMIQEPLSEDAQKSFRLLVQKMIQPINTNHSPSAHFTQPWPISIDQKSIINENRQSTIKTNYQPLINNIPTLFSPLCLPMDIMESDQPEQINQEIEMKNGSQLGGAPDENGTKDNLNADNIGNKLLEKKNGIIEQCRFILHNSKEINGRHLKCKVCSVMIVIMRNTGGPDPHLALDHACSHTARPRFYCRVCGHQARVISSLRSHMGRRHGGGQIKVQLDQLPMDAAVDIMDTFRQCFGYQHETSIQIAMPSPVPMKNTDPIQLKVVKRARKEKDSTTKIDHNGRYSRLQERIGQLVSKFGKADKLQCAICQQCIATVHRRHGRAHRENRSIIGHVQFHLNLPLFRCNYCQITKCTLRAFNDHKKRRHPQEDFVNSYIDYSDQYEMEIITKLAQCFDHTNAQSSESGPGQLKDPKDTIGQDTSETDTLDSWSSGEM